MASFRAPAPEIKKAPRNPGGPPGSAWLASVAAPAATAAATATAATAEGSAPAAGIAVAAIDRLAAGRLERNRGQSSALVAVDFVALAGTAPATTKASSARGTSAATITTAVLASRAARGATTRLIGEPLRCMKFLLPSSEDERRVAINAGEVSVCVHLNTPLPGTI